MAERTLADRVHDTIGCHTILRDGHPTSIGAVAGPTALREVAEAVMAEMQPVVDAERHAAGAAWLLRDDAEAERDRLREFARDVAEHGLRADLTPTVDTRDARTTYAQMAGFLRRIDGDIRLRARRVLDGGSDG